MVHPDLVWSLGEQEPEGDGCQRVTNAVAPADGEPLGLEPLCGGILFGNESDELDEMAKVVEDTGESDRNDRRWYTGSTARDASTSSDGGLGTAAGEEPWSENTVAVNTCLVWSVAGADAKRDGRSKDSDLSRVNFNHYETSDVGFIGDGAADR